MHDIKHHFQGIKIVLAMMPRLGLHVPKELLAFDKKDVAFGSKAFNLHHELTFFDSLIDLMNDPLLGIKIGKAFYLEAYGVFGLAISTGPTLRATFKFIEEFGQLTYSFFKFSTVIKQQYCQFNLIPSNLKLPPKLQIFYADRDISALILALNTIMREEAQLSHATFTHFDQDKAHQYREFLGCDVKFNQTTNSICFPVEWLDRELPLAHHSAHEFCVKECRLQLSKLAQEGDLIGRIRQEFLQQPGYLHNFETIAHTLNISTRTLRRRLAELDTSYQKLQQEMKFKAAKEYLINSKLQLQEIAEILGYSESGTFSNAFKLWSQGLSPREYRKTSGL